MENKVDRKQAVGSLLMQAKKYRNFARWIGDWETAQRILALAEELRSRALALARPDERRSASAPVKSGKKTAGRPEGMRNSGCGPNRNFVRLKSSREKPATTLR